MPALCGNAQKGHFARMLWANAVVVALLTGDAPHRTRPAASSAQYNRRSLGIRVATACGSGTAILSAMALPLFPARADVASQVLQFDADGKLLDDYSGETQFRTLRHGATSMRILAAWKLQEDGSYDDPTLGSAAAGIEMRSCATDRVDTAALGRPERMDLIRTLELEPELQRADLVAAAVRKSDGVTFYDFDLALSPKVCGTEMATACLPEKVILLSCAVSAGELYVARVDASAAQWKRAGAALRLLRSSFTINA